MLNHRFPFSVLVLSCIALTAAAQGWEAPVQSAPAYTPPPAAPRYSPPRQVPPRAQPAPDYTHSQDRFPDAAPSTVYGPRYGEMPYELYCQTLDSPYHRLSFLSATYTPKSTFGSYGESATLEVEGALRLFAFEEFLAGHLEGTFEFRVLSYLNKAGIDALPDAAAHLAFDITTSWRFWNGWSLELGAAPGIYSDITDPQFNCPATVNFHYTLNHALAGVGGITVRPDWDMPVFPNVGVAWQPSDFFRLEAMLPRSRVMLSPFGGLALFGTLEWRNFDFYLEGKDGLPEAYTVDEWLATAGIAIGMGGDVRLTAEAGTYLNREIKANVTGGSTISVSEEWLARIGLHGAF